MKKFLLGIILPLLTIVTLIGTGFATWYFNDNLTTSQQTDVTVSVEKYAQVGNIEISKGTYQVKLDQPSTTAQNITLVEASALTTPATLTGTYTQGPSLNANDPNADYTKQVNLVIKVTLTANLAKYITLDSANGWSTSDNLTYTKTPLTTDGKSNNTLSLTSADFKYATSGTSTGVVGEPKDKKAYEQMVTDVANQNITVIFEANVIKQ